MEYNSKPSILYEFKDKFVEFMQTTNGCTNSDKKVVDDLAEDYNMRIVETNQYDVDNVGYKRSIV